MRAAYTSQKSLCNYIRTINGIDTGEIPTRTAQIVFFNAQLCHPNVFDRDTVVSLSDKIHEAFGMAKSCNKKGGASNRVYCCLPNYRKTGAVFFGSRQGSSSSAWLRTGYSHGLHILKNSTYIVSLFRLATTLIRHFET